MKIDKLSQLFGGYQAQTLSTQKQAEISEATKSQDAAKVSLSSLQNEEATNSADDRAEKIKQLKAKHDAGLLHYDSEKVAVALVRDLGI